MNTTVSPDLMPQPFELQPPDISAWRAGNTGVEGLWRFDSGQPGRQVLVTALVHGNELCGAWALTDALQHGLRPRRGSLTLAFANLAAFDCFDPDHTDSSRFVDTDMNRLWGSMPWLHNGTTQRSEHQRVLSEHQRVLQLLPFVQASDWLLDLHSMHQGGPPLGLVGPLPHHAQQALQLGAPTLLVADSGHAAGCRLRDHGRWGDAADAAAFSLLVECGWHGAQSAHGVALDALHRFLTASGCVDAADMPAAWLSQATATPQRLLQVTQAITVAAGPSPQFAQAWAGGQVVEKAGTLLGHNGGQPFVTPYDHCVLVMPTLVHATAGSTLVRLAREVVA
jgi:predicted deacylase